MRLRALRVWLGIALACGVQSASMATPAFEALLERADAVRSVDPARFAELLAELNRSADQAGPLGKQQLQYLNAYSRAYSGQFDAAIGDLELLFVEAMTPELRFRTAALLANSFAATRQFAEGLSYLEQLLSLLPMIDNAELRHQGLGVVALIYNQVGQYQLAREYSELILADDPSPRSRCAVGLQRFEALYHLAAFPSDNRPLEAILAQCSGLGETVWAGLTRALLARKLFDDGDTERAIDLLEQSMGEMVATRYPRMIGEVHALLARFKLSRGDLAAAEHHAAQAIEMSAGSAYTLPVVTAYHALYESAVRRGDAEQALDYYRSYGAADKAYLNEIKARELAYQLAKQETLRKTQTIEILNKQNEVLRLQQQVASHAAQNNRLLLALLAVLLTSIGAWAYRTKRVQMSFRRLAEVDALTGISNRRHFIGRAEAALEYASRSGQNVCLLVFDLDHFKAVNDSHGHPVGDWALKAVTEVCRQACRKNDLIGRIGGEEFAMLLIGCDVAAAMHTAEICRQRIEAIDTAGSGASFPVSASFGLAQTRDAGYQFKSLLVQADKALYRSKGGGRNRVTMFDPDWLPKMAAAIGGVADASVRLD
jgi:diguanylate cyclase